MIPSRVHPPLSIVNSLYSSIAKGNGLGDCPLMSRRGVKRNPRQPEHGAPLTYISPLYIIPMPWTWHGKSKA